MWCSVVTCHSRRRRNGEERHNFTPRLRPTANAVTCAAKKETKNTKVADSAMHVCCTVCLSHTYQTCYCHGLSGHKPRCIHLWADSDRRGIRRSCSVPLPLPLLQKDSRQIFQPGENQLQRHYLNIYSQSEPGCGLDLDRIAREAMLFLF